MAQASEAAELLAIMTGEVPVENAVKDGGPARVREVVSRGEGDEESAVPIVAKDFQDAGLVTIWDAQGKPSLTNRNMLPTQLRKVDTSGQKMFFLHRPDVMKQTATALCWLHPDQPERAEYDTLGLTTCKKVLLNEFHAREHVRKCHPIAWKTIEMLRERKEKEIDRELQRAILRQAGQHIPSGITENSDGEPMRRRGRPVKEAVATAS